VAKISSAEGGELKNKHMKNNDTKADCFVKDNFQKG